MVVPVKIGFGILGLSSVAVGCTSIYFSLSPNTIGEELLKKGAQLIPKEDSKWSTLATNHISLEKKNPPKNEKINTIQGLDLKSKESTSKEDLFKKCEELLNTPLNDKNNELERKKEEAKNWCVTGAQGFSIEAK